MSGVCSLVDSLTIATGCKDTSVCVYIALGYVLRVCLRRWCVWHGTGIRVQIPHATPKRPHNCRNRKYTTTGNIRDTRTAPRNKSSKDTAFVRSSVQGEQNRRISTSAFLLRSRSATTKNNTNYTHQKGQSATLAYPSVNIQASVITLGYSLKQVLCNCW